MENKLYNDVGITVGMIFIIITEFIIGGDEITMNDGMMMLTSVILFLNTWMDVIKVRVDIDNKIVQFVGGFAIIISGCCVFDYVVGILCEVYPEVTLLEILLGSIIMCVIHAYLKKIHE